MVTKNKTIFCGLFLVITISYSTKSAQAADILPVKPPVVRPPKVIKELPDKAKQDLDAEKALITAESATAQQIKQTTKAIDELYSGLPDTLPIVDSSGQVAFTETTVEGGWRAVKNQWLVLLTPSEKKQLPAIKAHITSEKELPGLGLSLVQFTLPDSLDSYEKLKQRLPKSMVQKLGRNHIYNASSNNNVQTNSAVAHQSWKTPICDKPARVGMIDTAVDTHHLAFQNSTIEQKPFIEQGIKQPSAHGTAVAGLLVGQYETLQSPLTNAELFTASVFYSRNQVSQGATLLHLIKAIDWLVSSQVKVINMSLTGPDNPVLKLAISNAVKRQVVIVAAAGNDGPTAGPRYPAAYTDVIAVTAVDDKKQIYRWANQGDYIDFATYGVSVLTARKNNQLGRETGTSMAAPLVTAMSACLAKDQSINDLAGYVKQQIESRAEDLGEPGKDPVFGYGFIVPY